LIKEKKNARIMEGNYNGEEEKKMRLKKLLLVEEVYTPLSSRGIIHTTFS